MNLSETFPYTVVNFVNKFTSVIGVWRNSVSG